MNVGGYYMPVIGEIRKEARYLQLRAELKDCCLCTNQLLASQFRLLLRGLGGPPGFSPLEPSEYRVNCRSEKGERSEYYHQRPGVSLFPDDPPELASPTLYRLRWLFAFTVIFGAICAVCGIILTAGGRPSGIVLAFVGGFVAHGSAFLFICPSDE
jgi:hypothetical protein